MQADVVIGDRGRLQREVSSGFARAAASALQERGRFTVALPGGSVATHFFPPLARLTLDWSRVHFFWVDERAVPPTDPDSNYALAAALWFDPASVPAESVHRMK